MFQDDKFEFSDVVGMDPVFRGITNKVLLRAAGRGVSLDRVATGADKVVLFGEFDHQGVVVFSEEWLCVETSGEDGFEDESCLFLIR